MPPSSLCFFAAVRVLWANTGRTQAHLAHRRPSSTLRRNVANGIQGRPDCPLGSSLGCLPAPWRLALSCSLRWLHACAARRASPSARRGGASRRHRGPRHGPRGPSPPLLSITPFFAFARVLLTGVFIAVPGRVGQGRQGRGG